ncbi:MAG: DUF4240 domain-containing protein [Anaerolineae bacterium]|nr:MAG: DUF4240 domain-containing protein [Anaerolineae bacterium]
MDEIRFWQLIDEVRESGTDSVQTLIAKLSQLPPEEILAYQKHFYDVMDASYTSTLWAAAYIIAGGCSDDSFSDFRAWLIMQGQTTFWRVVADPEVLAELVESDDIFWEEIIYAPREAHERITRNENFGELYIQKYGYSQPPEIVLDWGEDEDKLQVLLPKLYAKFGE